MKITDVLKKLDNEFLNPVCIVNLDFPDQPITFANKRFCEFTHYKSELIVGRNCRFLQGPLTDQEGIARVREALKNKTPLCQDLINYKSDGTIFYNRLVLVPFKESNQHFFLGLQNEIDEKDFKRQHFIGHLEILDKTMNPISILMGLLSIDRPDLEKDLLPILNRIRNYILSR